MRRGILLGSALAALAVMAGAAPASADTVWLCKPGLEDNPCEIGQQTTVREPSGEERVETPSAGEKPVDCFYVYPTVSNQLTPNATKAKDPELASIARYQAARFSLECRVFAPVYRQRTLAALATAELQDSDQTTAVAYADVLEAWEEYLAEHNDGRGVVLIGHSQGTSMLRRLVSREIDDDPAVRGRIVSALLLGGDVLVRRGEATGGDFDNVPLCERPGQWGCVVAFSTFAEDPPAEPRFGTPAEDEEGLEVACTDPRKLAGSTDPLRVLVPSEPYAPGIIAAGIVVTNGGPPPSAPTPWVVPPDRFEGTCERIGGAHVLRYDPLEGSRRPNPFPDDTWGTHLIDVNLALDPLLEVVRRQTERYLEPKLELTRRCGPGGRLAVELRGDVQAVRDVSFEAGRRQLSRDTEAPFRRELSRRAVARGAEGDPLRAVAYLRGGREREILTRSMPRC